jgi:hypothetical protein
MTNLGKSLTKLFHAFRETDMETSRRVAKSMAEFERVRLASP